MPDPTGREFPELLPCPFCGEQPLPEAFAFVDGQGRKWGRVECSCGACGPDVRTSYKPVAHWAPDAAAAWNTRTGEAADVHTELKHAWDEVVDLEERNGRMLAELAGHDELAR